jgi:uncharacterized membrane protein
MRGPPPNEQQLQLARANRRATIAIVIAVVALVISLRPMIAGLLFALGIFKWG